MPCKARRDTQRERRVGAQCSHKRNHCIKQHFAVPLTVLSCREYAQNGHRLPTPQAGRHSTFWNVISMLCVAVVASTEHKLSHSRRLPRRKSQTHFAPKVQFLFTSTFILLHKHTWSSSEREEPSASSTTRSSLTRRRWRCSSKPHALRRPLWTEKSSSSTLSPVYRTHSHTHAHIEWMMRLIIIWMNMKMMKERIYFHFVYEYK